MQNSFVKASIKYIWFYGGNDLIISCKHLQDNDKFIESSFNDNIYG